MRIRVWSGKRTGVLDSTDEGGVYRGSVFYPRMQAFFLRAGDMAVVAPKDGDDIEHDLVHITKIEVLHA